jgi:hypothetical protein
MHMSLGTFFKKVEQALFRFLKNPSWEQKADGVITYVAPVLEEVIVLTLGTPAETVAAAVISRVQSGLATVSAILLEAQVTPGTSVAKTVTIALNSVKDNLTGLLTAAEVKNTTKSTQITSTVNMLVGEIDALLGSMPTSTSTPAAPVAPAAPVVSK